MAFLPEDRHFIGIRIPIQLISLTLFFSNFWGVGLGTLSNSLFFGDPQNRSPLGPAFKKRDNISEFKKMLILYRTAFCAGAKTIQDRASVHT